MNIHLHISILGKLLARVCCVSGYLPWLAWYKEQDDKSPFLPNASLADW